MRSPKYLPVQNYCDTLIPKWFSLMSQNLYWISYTRNEIEIKSLNRIIYITNTDIIPNTHFSKMIFVISQNEYAFLTIMNSILSYCLIQIFDTKRKCTTCAMFYTPMLAYLESNADGRRLNIKFLWFSSAPGHVFNIVNHDFLKKSRHFFACMCFIAW